MPLQVKINSTLTPPFDRFRQTCPCAACTQNERTQSTGGTFGEGSQPMRTSKREPAMAKSARQLSTAMRSRPAAARRCLLSAVPSAASSCFILRSLLSSSSRRPALAESFGFFGARRTCSVGYPAYVHPQHGRCAWCPAPMPLGSTL